MKCKHNKIPTISLHIILIQMIMLQTMTSLLTSDKSDNPRNPTSGSALFLEMERLQDEKRSEVKDALVTLDMITKMIETCGETCLKQVKHMIQFVQVMSLFHVTMKYDKI